MIPFRPLLRHSYLSLMGNFKKISPCVHILNGHIIGDKREQGKDRFNQLLQRLSAHVDFVNIEQACELIIEKAHLTRPAVAFTFDDGFDDCYHEIAPALERFNVNAAFFINPNFTYGDDEYIHKFLKEKAPHLSFRKPMNEAMVKELHNRGFIIGAHGLDHERLVSNNPAFLERQIKDCKEKIEDMLQSECSFFAWPYGKYSDISDEAMLMIQKLFRYNFSSDQYSSYMSAKVFNRRHFECDWPANHLHYFLACPRHA
ncbi:polysaccharide deacetylase family protein [Legionella lytica]|uniref:Polysaccharide deacetylase family protein n=1 Tax=Legionella lytica TaxID=96232 RepID=A0ABY4Y7K5_9GAMM|nr:polysaccharide deacetylase family protein [Legionella lytica]USQ13519.1 polysaccharide deacetylase family protein [Legionella lytica]